MEDNDLNVIIGEGSDMMDKSLHFVKTVDGIEYYVFKPSLGNWFFKKWDGYKEDNKKDVIHWLRMCLEWIEGGYDVYYQVVSDEIVGYLTVAPGGRRLTLSNKNDIVIGPIYTIPSKRGRGYASKAMIVALNELGIKYNNAYEFIKKSNKSSLKVSEKCGYEIIGQVSSKGLFRKLYPKDNGFYYLLRYSKNQ